MKILHYWKFYQGKLCALLISGKHFELVLICTFDKHCKFYIINLVDTCFKGKHIKDRYYNQKQIKSIITKTFCWQKWSDKLNNYSVIKKVSIVKKREAYTKTKLRINCRQSECRMSFQDSTSDDVSVIIVFCYQDCRGHIGKEVL